MEKLKRGIYIILISFCLATIFCVLQLNGYFKKIIYADDLKMENIAIFLVQHESNPLEKNFECFNDLYKKIIFNQKDGYRYYELYFQFLENKREKQKFYSYYTDELEENCPIIKTVQIGETVLEDSDITIETGKLFETKDYEYNNKEIPIILGNCYLDLYKVGDTFNFEYLYDEYTFKVIGILENNSIINLEMKNVILDKYIIMPSFSVDENMPITDGIKIHYANKISGIIKLDINNIDYFYTKIEPLLLNANVGEYSWNARPTRIYFKKIFGIEYNVFQIVVYFICFILILLETLLVKFFVQIESKKEQPLKYFLYAVLLFLLTSIIYFIIQYVYILCLGIKIIQIKYLMIFGLVSILIIFFCWIINKGKGSDSLDEQ